MIKERNIGIDVLKFFAALLITNSHMGLLYGKYSFLATGGSIGDALFFFCSGFTLFLKPMEGIKQFPDWYKRRINRIYPTVFAVAILACTFFNGHRTINEIILYGGGWFVSCIMLYYIAIHFVGSYLKDKIYWVIALVFIATGIWFYFIYQTPNLSIYSPDCYIRWLFYFAFMLLGAKMGTITGQIKLKPKTDWLMLLLCIIVFYGIFIASIKFQKIVAIQYLSVFPLLGTMYYAYKVCNGRMFTKIYNSKTGNFVIRFIGGLCLEIYLVQFYLFTDKMNHIFPLNILIMFLIIFVAAYLTRCFARIISQTFKEAPYDWKQVIDFY